MEGGGRWKGRGLGGRVKGGGGRWWRDMAREGPGRESKGRWRQRQRQMAEGHGKGGARKGERREVEVEADGGGMWHARGGGR